MGELDAPGLRLMAQCYQESRLDAFAYNETSGASGECQFMGGAWSDCMKAANLRNVSRFNRRQNIKCAARFMRKLRLFWSSPRPILERWRLQVASYNAGPGNVLKAQTLAGGALIWREIAPSMHCVTGQANSRETLGYVVNIERWFAMLQQEGA